MLWRIHQAFGDWIIYHLRACTTNVELHQIVAEKCHIGRAMEKVFISGSWGNRFKESNQGLWHNTWTKLWSWELEWIQGQGDVSWLETQLRCFKNVDKRLQGSPDVSFLHYSHAGLLPWHLNFPSQAKKKNKIKKVFRKIIYVNFVWSKYS